MLTKYLLLIFTAATLMFGTTIPIQGVSRGIRTTPVNKIDPAEFIIEFFPVAPYHIGDVLSIRVTYTGSSEIGGQIIGVSLSDDPGNLLDTAAFSSHTRQAVFYWVLDTSDFIPGFIDFTFNIQELNTNLNAGIHLLPSPENRDQEWAVHHTTCCTIYYITGTDAESEIETVIEILEERTKTALAQIYSDDIPVDYPLPDPIALVLIPIVVGHGGFATNEAVMTYSQRNWAGIGLETLAHHEIVHVLDRQINDEGPRPSLFVEGIAVYLSGGHYREGDPLLRAAALLEMDMYIPIVEMTDDFYAAQHEIGYMEAAGLVAYLNEIWGWEAFLEFYFNLPEAESDSQIISSALEDQFGIDLASLEAEFIAYLENLKPDEQIKADVRLTVEVYDMIRRYQTLAFPSAHFRTAWWPPMGRMREEGIVSDYAYREKAPFNIIVESLFLDIHTGFEIKDYESIYEKLLTIDQVLSEVESTESAFSHYSIRWPLYKLAGVPFRP